MKTTIYFVRHGEVHNPQNVFYGRMPRFRLSKRGEKQIEQTAKFLTNRKIDILYASPLLRARQTAKIIQKTLHLPTIHYAKDILEIDTIVEGKSFVELDFFNDQIFASEENTTVGETFKNLAERMQKFLLKTNNKYPGKRIVAVSHGDPITMIKALHRNLHETIEDFRSVPGPYITHGEVLETEVENGKLFIAKTIFTPSA